MEVSKGITRKSGRGAPGDFFGLVLCLANTLIILAWGFGLPPWGSMASL